MNNHNKIKIFLLLILIIFNSILCGCSLKNTYDYPISYDATIIYTLNPNAPKIMGINITDIILAKPISWESQEIKNIKYNTEPFGELTYPYPLNNKLNVWRINNIHNYKEITISMKIEFISYNVSFNINPKNVGEYNKSSIIYKSFTRAEPYIESDNEMIIDTAKKIVGNEQNSYEKAKAIFDWVVENMEFDNHLSSDPGALYALKNKRGDCSEYSTLYVALCRSVGIPSRLVYGYNYIETLNNKKTDSHMWAEVYLENIGWIPADPTGKDNYDPNKIIHPKNASFDFGNIPNSLLILGKGTNLRINTIPPENYFTPIYLPSYEGYVSYKVNISLRK